MNTLVRRRLELKPGKKEEFLEMAKEYKEHLKKDEDLEAFLISTPKEEDDVVIFSLALKEGSDWDKRMEKEYIQDFLKELEEKDLLDEIKTSHYDIHHHHIL